MNNLEEKMQRIDRIAEIDQFEREKLKADLEFSRKPVWMQAVEKGDRLNDGSDEQEYGED